MKMQLSVVVREEELIRLLKGLRRASRLLDSRGKGAGAFEKGRFGGEGVEWEFDCSIARLES